MFQSFTNIFGTVISVLGGIASLVALILGIISLFFGRKLFWVFAALIGLSVGLIVGAQLLQEQAVFVRVLVAISIAAICAALAIYAEKIMIVLAGFLGLGAFGYLISNLFKLPTLFHWILFIGMGILGAVLISKYMEWAIVIISSVIGAIMAGAGLGGLTHFNFLIDLLIFLGLLAAGIFFQSRNLRKA
jgi:hypothetical protein